MTVILIPMKCNRKLAKEVEARTGQTVSYANFRKTLQRARGRFAQLVYQVVAESLRDPSPDRIAEELAELGLLRYCRSAVAKRGNTEG